MQPFRGAKGAALVRGEPVGVPDAADEVVHVWLAVGEDLDVDRAGPTRSHDLAGRDGGDAMPEKESGDRITVLAARPRQELEGTPEPLPVPRHVEDAAARQDVTAREVVVEADRAHEERV